MSASHQKYHFLFDPVRTQIVSFETRQSLVSDEYLWASGWSAVHMKDTHKATFVTYIRSYPVGIEVFYESFNSILQSFSMQVSFQLFF